MKTWRLVADIGGTNTRFARADSSGALHAIVSFATNAHANFANALDIYLVSTGGAEGCMGAAIGAAGPVDDGTVTLTNHAAWTIRDSEIRKILAGAPTSIVNDLQAVAAALPFLAPDDIVPVGGPSAAASPQKPMLALNVGTGLGAAVAMRHAGVWFTAPAEPGHMSLPPTTADMSQAWSNDATAESVLSGPGLAQLYARLSDRDMPGDACAIFDTGSTDPVAATAVSVFTQLLGRFAGDLVLATGTWGGVYLCGSVAAHWTKRADTARFRAAFEAKGPMTQRMKNVPTLLIRRPDVALFGLARLPLPG